MISKLSGIRFFVKVKSGLYLLIQLILILIIYGQLNKKAELFRLTLQEFTNFIFLQIMDVLTALKLQLM
jgi:hypothetical protein